MGRFWVKKADKGYTLVETLVSILLGALVIAGVAFSLDSGHFITGDNHSRVYAENAMREELETLRRTNYDTFVNLGATSSFSNAQLVKLQSGSGTRSIASTSMGADIKKLTLTVSWKSRSGRTLNESLTTYVTRRGLNGS
jgi:type II secretory pathway pseudopilin PulG